MSTTNRPRVNSASSREAEAADDATLFRAAMAGVQPSHRPPPSSTAMPAANRPRLNTAPHRDADDADSNNATDGDLFRDAMAGVRRFHRPPEVRHDPARPSTPKTPLNIGEPALTAAHPNAGVMVDSTEGEYLEFCRGGLQRKKFQRLKSAQHELDATLELHGKTAAEAQHALNHFLAAAVTARCSVVLIIHGKGHRSPAGSVLKPLTATHLKTIAAVQAFCSAHPKDGGTGALYVLLRKAAAD